MKKNKLEKHIINAFKDRKSFTRNDLYKYIRKNDPDLKDSTIYWRIDEIKRKHNIQSIGRGLYRVDNKPLFTPMPDEMMIKIAKIIKKEYYEATYCIWNSGWLNEFSIHQTQKTFYIIEIDKDIKESIYFRLLDEKIGNIFLEPNSKEMYYKVSQVENPIIVKKLITRSPLQIINNVSIPTLEKIIVDLFADKKIFFMYQEDELSKMLRNMLSDYNVNILSTLLNYAQRRNKNDFISKILYQSPNSLVDEINTIGNRANYD